MTLIMQALAAEPRSSYAGKYVESVSYPGDSRSKCDLCLGHEEPFEWAIELKMARMLGDNGKPNDNLVMHLLSPYDSHRSALTDCTKLAASSLGDRRAVVIYGYEADAYPLEPLVAAFETLATSAVRLGTRQQAAFGGLVHPVHREGSVYGWEVSI